MGGGGVRAPIFFSSFFSGFWPNATRGTMKKAVLFRSSLLRRELKYTMQCKISGGDETTGDEDGQRHQGICFC